MLLISVNFFWKREHVPKKYYTKTYKIMSAEFAFKGKVL